MGFPRRLRARALVVVGLALLVLLPAQSLLASGAVRNQNRASAVDIADFASDVNPTVGSCSFFCTVANIPLGTSPAGLAYDSAKGEVFVSNQGSDNVSVISDLTDTVVGTIAVGASPMAAVYDAEKGEIFVVNGLSNNVSVISDASDKVVATIAVATSSTGGNQAAYDSGKGEILLTNGPADVVNVISDATNTVIANVTIDSNPCGITYDGAKGEFFVVENHADAVAVVNDTNDTVVTTVPFGTFPLYDVYDSEKGEVFADEDPFQPGPYSVAVISDSNNTVAHTVPLNGVTTLPLGMAYDNSAGDVFLSVAGTNGASSSCGSQIAVISDSTNSVVGNVTAGHCPSFLVYDSGTNEIFVTNSLSNNASVIGKVAPAPVIAAVSISPSSSGLAPGASQSFSARSTTMNGSLIAVGVSYTWSFAPSSLGILNSTIGSGVMFTAASVRENGTIFVNATYGEVTKEGTASIADTGAAASSSPPFLSALDLILIAALVVVAVALAAMFLTRRKRGAVGGTVSVGPPPNSPPKS